MTTKLYIILAFSLSSLQLSLAYLHDDTFLRGSKEFIN
ncbi:Uncharacterised protein [Algoriella xinjiangensis]|nr:Uncharacterised protein [Algoriella xinjiangensis]